MEFKFTIVYFVDREHINEEETRKAIVYHSSLKRAIDLIKIIDENFTGLCSVEYEEVKSY